MAGNMDWLGDNWGSVIGTLGLVATVVGLFVVFRRAGEARRSADASRVAAQETQLAISGVLTIVDLERAKAIVQRIKQLHMYQKWEISLELYQPLREMLTNIHTRGTIETPELAADIRQLSVIEENITSAVSQGEEPSGVRNFPMVLNDIQMRLEQLASSTHLPGSERN